jgi:hypothetical protein
MFISLAVKGWLLQLVIWKGACLHEEVHGLWKHVDYRWGGGSICSGEPHRVLHAFVRGGALRCIIGWTEVC